jgi:hypothetical protein
MKPPFAWRKGLLGKPYQWSFSFHQHYTRRILAFTISSLVPGVIWREKMHPERIVACLVKFFYKLAFTSSSERTDTICPTNMPSFHITESTTFNLPKTNNHTTNHLITRFGRPTVTYDHRHRRTRDPVRSPIDKPMIARSVLGWVTTGESLVLYVLSFAIT